MLIKKLPYANQIKIINYEFHKWLIWGAIVLDILTSNDCKETIRKKY